MNKLGSFFLITVLILPVRSEAEEQGCDQVLARILSIQGTVEKKQLEAHEWIRIENGSLLCANETVRTLKRSRATVEVINETIVSLDENTTLLFSKEEDDSLYAWLADLFTGKIFLRSREPHRLKVNTPFINAAHEGTEFMVSAEADHGEVWVFDGQVTADNQYGKVTVEKGQKAVAFEGQAPQIKPIKISPEDAVQWLLYYPPILEDHTPGQEPLNTKSPDFFNQHASNLLSLGRVDEAQNALNKAKSLAPDNANSLALEAVIAVAKNRSDQALNLASRAVKKEPQSAAARIAHSYALQSKFMLEEALETMEQAVNHEPSHAIAWARLAELQLSMGDQDSALESAQTAEKLNPTLGRTQIILGFADLAQVDIEEAKQAFEQAIQLDSTDPLARLGLGLAKIRQGDVEEGTRDMEAAVSLDPDNALMRSYLGKAYYELKNTSYATTELAIAKEKDPKDPTPWFYDAIRKQTTNRPVEALHDMQKAIELNDNRGVYRSKLLLDEDLAARSASLGRIYNDLGFQQRGLLEGWKSTSLDPDNYSAHRLLADNYAALPRHEIARVSELLQSQLLQPVNITPVQPQLAESNVLTLNGLGPKSTSFNEFNPLFIRNRFAMQASGIYGSNDTWGDEITHSGLWNQFSYSLGQHHYESNGFRENNHLKRDIYNGFFQFSLTPNLNFQSEIRYTDTASGDLPLRFDPENFSKTLKNEKIEESVRFGSRYKINSNSNILLSFIRNDINEIGTGLDFDISENLDLTGYTSEIQYILNQSEYNLILGGGYVNINSILTTSQFGLLNQTIDNSDHTDIYLYLKTKFFKELEATLGVSYSNTEDLLPFGVPLKRSQFNPKFGLIWTPYKDLTFRGAAFRTLKRLLASNATIEPTNISGFNQFFDDINASDIWVYGLAADYRFSKTLLSGITFSKRKLDVPFSFSDFSSFPPPPPSLDYSSWTEENIRGYLYWTPHNLIAINLEYNYERFYRSEKNPGIELLRELNTHRTSIGFNFFDYSGFFVKVKGTHFDQNGLFVNPIFRTEKTGTDNFWLIDATIGFRLPKRYGVFSINVNNLFNQSFNYQDTDPSNPTVYPDRTIFGRINLSF